MRIADGQLSLSSTHTLERSSTHTHSMRAWTGAPPSAPRTPMDEVSVSSGGSTAAADADAEDAAVPADLKLLLALVRWLLKGKVDDKALRDLAQRLKGSSGQSSQPAHPAADARQPSGAGFELRSEDSTVERESTTFTAQATVRTTDGREIAVDLRVALAREHVEVRQTVLRGGAPEAKDPLVLNYGAPAATLTDRRASFDLDANGTLDSIPTLGAGSAFLALDGNGNGRIDDGRELFGPSSGNGFLDLAAHDADGNGWIDEADPVFGRLRLWEPTADGVGSLRTLADLGVGAIALQTSATPFTYEDAATGATLGAARATSLYLTEDGEARSIQQVDLAV